LDAEPKATFPGQAARASGATMLEFETLWQVDVPLQLKARAPSRKVEDAAFDGRHAINE